MLDDVIYIKYRVIYNEKAEQWLPPDGRERGVEGQGAQGHFGGDGYLHELDGGDAFTYICQNALICAVVCISSTPP